MTAHGYTAFPKKVRTEGLDALPTCGPPANEVTDHVADGVVYHQGCIPADVHNEAGLEP